MEKLTVDPDGKITIPPEITERRGLRPGDELSLVESAEGLLVYHGGLDEKTLQWWSRLDDQQRRLATTEAGHYESLSEDEKDAIWNEGADSIEVEAESDEIELPTK
ncbi:MAG TPA: AbrB/MazE/SpoVT family DNA-binding domain-containing protein [Pyrinomonadaceae bacterium]|nr:AbrB/MazE/SpoVT family DNA-binding domain-containing protein [Pyrinomonadaceae bacterium]